MINVHGPGDQFTLLFDEQSHLPPHLPEPVRAIYQGDWHPLVHANRPYTFINFVTSRDGRVSFAEPGHSGGGDVSSFSKADTWLMGLLRARADAVLVGDGTLRIEPDHVWTSEFIYPADREAFRAIRQHYGLKEWPLLVFLSLEGQIDPAAAVFSNPALQIVIATTTQGKIQAETLLRGCHADLHILDLGQQSVDLNLLMQLLSEHYQIQALLCEGGPRVYGSLLRAGLVDDEFLTLSPIMIGSAPGTFRPSLVEGAAFAPGQAPRSELIGLRRIRDHLFLHSRWIYPQP